MRGSNHHCVANRRDRAVWRTASKVKDFLGNGRVVNNADWLYWLTCNPADCATLPIKSSFEL